MDRTISVIDYALSDGTLERFLLDCPKQNISMFLEKVLHYMCHEWPGGGVEIDHSSYIPFSQLDLNRISFDEISSLDLFQSVEEYQAMRDGGEHISNPDASLAVFVERENNRALVIPSDPESPTAANCFEHITRSLYGSSPRFYDECAA